MKESYRKSRYLTKKAMTMIGIFVVALIFIYCILCLFAKVLLYENETVATTDVATTDVADDNSVDTSSSYSANLRKILVLEDFAYTALGAMFGFGASLIVEKYVLYYTKKKAFTNLVDEIIQMITQLGNLRNEKLIVIDEIIASGKVTRPDLENKNNDLQKAFRTVKYYKDVLYFPIWESILQNGDLLYFREENYFSSLIKVYTRLIKIKHMIDDQDVDNSNIEGVYYYLMYLDLNIREFLTSGNDFEDSLLDAIDDVIKKSEENYNYKDYFEVNNA